MQLQRDHKDHSERDKHQESKGQKTKKPSKEKKNGQQLQQVENFDAKTANLTDREVAILSLLRSICQITLGLPEKEWDESIQRVKSALYIKDYAEAFGSSSNQEIYACRWVPSRCLLFCRIFLELKPVKDLLQNESTSPRLIWALGGGAGSEVLALAGMSNVRENPSSLLTIRTLDCADWSSVLNPINEWIHKPCSKDNPGTLAVEEGWGVAASAFKLECDVVDVLSPESMVSSTSPDLITINYTVSELFLQSRIGTLNMFSHLSAVTKPGAMLLIVESAALAVVPVGVSNKTFSLGLILDHALQKDWYVAATEDGRYFRLPAETKDEWPRVKLENAKVFYRLYIRR